jgi:hypothetical protein
LRSFNAGVLDTASWIASPSIHLLLGGEEGVGGGTSALRQRASAWEGIYEQPNLFSHFGLQIRYLNEGCLGPTNVPWAIRLSRPLHYRDAYGLQLSYWSALHSHCRIAAAFGPEIYFDTMTSIYRAQYQDRHGIGIQPSISGQCRLNSRLALEVVASQSLDVASFGATAVLLGMTYTPRSPAERDDSEDNTSDARHKYLELTAGRAEVDSFRLSHEIGSAIWATYVPVGPKARATTRGLRTGGQRTPKRGNSTRDFDQLARTSALKYGLQRQHDVD